MTPPATGRRRPRPPPRAPRAACGLWPSTSNGLSSRRSGGSRFLAPGIYIRRCRCLSSTLRGRCRGRRLAPRGRRPGPPRPARRVGRTARRRRAASAFCWPRTCDRPSRRSTMQPPTDAPCVSAGLTRRRASRGPWSRRTPQTRPPSSGTSSGRRARSGPPSRRAGAARHPLAGDFNCVLHAEDSAARGAAYQPAQAGACALRLPPTHFNLSDLRLHQQATAPSSSLPVYPLAGGWGGEAPRPRSRVGGLAARRLHVPAPALGPAAGRSLRRGGGGREHGRALAGGAAFVAPSAQPPGWTTSSGVACAPSWLTAKPAGAPSGALSRRAAWLAAPPGAAGAAALGGAAPRPRAPARLSGGEALEERLSRLARARQAELRRERRAARGPGRRRRARRRGGSCCRSGGARRRRRRCRPRLRRVRAEAARLGGRREGQRRGRRRTAARRCGISTAEQPTSWFHRLGRGAQAPAPPMRAIEDPSAGRPVTADTLAGSAGAGGPRRRPLRRRSRRPFRAEGARARRRGA